ncbi:hypothetical protein EYZ11_007298 [Aspergillus tanneri]|uniref:Uncharacterized protein n=1 Tax=Aspergillus tanneri TaxID=1220188 RepID=A0A4S3JDA4_9EURO|nr:hypothetical protein EYZ11_007298 [Aspergillus tanneri]
MVWDPPSAQVSQVVFQPALSAGVEIVAPVKVIWLGRIGSYIENDEERVLGQSSEGVFLGLFDDLGPLSSTQWFLRGLYVE